MWDCLSKSEVYTYQARYEEETFGNSGPRPAQDDLERFREAEIALVVVVAGDWGDGISHESTHLGITEG